VLGFAQDPKVKGSTVDPALRFAERFRSTAAWNKFRSLLDPQALALLEQPVRRSTWYDLTAYARLLDAACQCFAPDESDALMQDLGKFVVDDGVNTLYRAFFAIASPSFVLKGSALLWGMFFRGNRLKVIDRGRKFAHVAIVDSSFCGLPLCRSIAGGMRSTLCHAGAQSPHLEEHRCLSQVGGMRCDFRWRWD
jgi:hypothetical protein